MKVAISVLRWCVTLPLIAIQLSCGGGDASGPRAAATISANSATTLSGSPGAPVQERPSVIVRDDGGSPLAGVTVTFAVTSGGGSLTGSTPVTDAAGIATVTSWTLGSAVGSNTVRASVASLPPVVFTATATDPCTSRTSHTLGTSTGGEIAATDCRLGNGFIDFFSTTVSPAGMYQFSQTASFDTFLYLYGADGFPMAVNDDESGATQNSRIKVLLPSGNFVLGATHFDPGITGPYTVSSAAASSVITDCELVFVARGTTTDQALQTTDCLFSGAYTDDVLIYLRAGQTVTIDMTSAAFDAFLELWNLGNVRVAFNDDRDGSTDNARLVFTPNATDFYLLVPTSAVGGQTGNYTLTVGP